LCVRCETLARVGVEVGGGVGSAAFRGEKSMFFDGEWVSARVFDRELLRAGDVLEGPALVAEYTSATVVAPGARVVVDGLRNLVMEVGEAE